MALNEDLWAEVFLALSRERASFSHALVCKEWHRMARDSLSHADVKISLDDSLPELPRRNSRVWRIPRFRFRLNFSWFNFRRRESFPGALQELDSGDRSPAGIDRADEISSNKQLIHELQQFPSLTSLSVTLNPTCGFEYFDLFERLFEIVDNLPRLRRLQVAGLQEGKRFVHSCHIQELFSSSKHLTEISFTEKPRNPFQKIFLRSVNLPQIALEDSISKLTSLRKLALDSIRLKSVSPEITCLTALTSLSANIFLREKLARTLITSLPNLRHMSIASALSRVTLASGKLLLRIAPEADNSSRSQRFARAVTRAIARLEDSAKWKREAIKARLFLHGVDWLPEDFFAGFTSLRTLCLHSDALLTLPPSIGRCAGTLSTLELHTSRLAILPFSLQHVQHLRKLSLRLESCTYSSLSSLLGNQGRLQCLSIQGMPGLTELCRTAGNWANLRELTLIQCPNLRCLPSGFQTLTSLENIQITRCNQLRIGKGSVNVAAVIMHDDPSQCNIQ